MLRSSNRLLLAIGTILNLSLAPRLLAAPPDPPVRMIAEWEPAAGVLISWPLGIPAALVTELAKDDHLYVLVNNAADDAACRAYMASQNIPVSRVTTILCPHNSHWTRDWGPHQIFDGGGQWRIVDAIFQGYPWVGQSCNVITSPGGYVLDDQSPTVVASFFGTAAVPLPAYLVGGNFLNDGGSRAFATCTQIAENLQLGSEADFRQKLASYLGVTNFIALQPTENNGIQHIDCWFKPLDDETLLVKRPPAWHEEFNDIEANLAVLANLTGPHGRPYRILRIDCPPYNGSRIAAYCNSLILNRKVYVPLFNIPGDAQAIATWQAAMPGYEVVGFPWGSWYYYDALHCRTRAIFDRHMLRMSHRRLDALVSPAAGYAISATIDDRSEAGLIPGLLRAYHSAAGAATWDWVPLTPGSQPDEYVATLPAYPPGTTVHYYLAASDFSGRSETLPRVAPAGFYTFTIDNPGPVISVPTPPTTVAPWTQTTFDVVITPNGEPLVPGSPRVHYRYTPDGPEYSAPLEPLGGNLYRATLPRFVCDDQPRFYVSAVGAVYGLRTAPAGAPASLLDAGVGTAGEVTLLTANFEGGLPAGWSTTGLWTVATSCAVSPTCDGVRWAYYGQPSTCTYNNGQRNSGILRSPPVAIPPLPPGGSATLRYCNTFVTENESGFDVGVVLAGGRPVDTPVQSLAWQTRTADLSALAGQTVQIEWRFDTIDNQQNSYRGWQVDGVQVTVSTLSCTAPLPFSPGDANCDGAVNFDDIDVFVLALSNLAEYAAQFPDCHWRSSDCNADGRVDFDDIDAFVAALGGQARGTTAP